MIELKVNGANRSFDGDPDMPLLWYLRDVLGALPEPNLAAAWHCVGHAPYTATVMPSGRASRR